MIRLKILVLVLTAQFAVSSIAVAGDFDWLSGLSIKAEADPSGFKATLGVRFKIGDVQIKTVLSNVKEPEDAYMVLRLGELSGLSTSVVLAKYRSNRGRGWGVLAKSLGIRPGSREFHALKRGHDLGEVRGGGRGKGKTSSYGGGKGKGKNKDKKRR